MNASDTTTSAAGTPEGTPDATAKAAGPGGAAASAAPAGSTRPLSSSGGAGSASAAAGSAAPAAREPELSAALAGTRRSLTGVRVFSIVALLIAVLAVLAAVWVWQRSEKVTREAVRRWQDGENRVAQVEQQARVAQDQVRDLIGRQAVLESKLGEAVGQQAQLEKLYKSISADNLDTVLADVENGLSIAAQQLLVGGNVQGALVALQDADSSLKRAEPASVAGLRRLIQRDIDALRAVPVTDIASLMVRLDSVAAALDQLPMLSGADVPVQPGSGDEASAAAREGAGGAGAAQEGATGAEAPTGTAPAASDGGSPLSLDRLAESGRRGWLALKSELQALIRVNRVDAPDAVLLAPSQQYFARENLRLTLLSARLAMLSRNDTVLRSDLQRAINWLNTYYDRNNKAVANAVTTLRQLGDNKVSYDLPSLAESMSAVRALRAAREGNR
ncbi:MAG TPA: uroporphyrinogen-III C-methyltransferase [Burkholderiaceae bacterium]|nr:uroporphyrinogen-III C-methyltransferase [Burkholderiaceae bacterium]